jgi:hypothetical protein
MEHVLQLVLLMWLLKLLLLLLLLWAFPHAWLLTCLGPWQHISSANGGSGSSGCCSF